MRKHKLLPLIIVYLFLAVSTSRAAEKCFVLFNNEPRVKFPMPPGLTEEQPLFGSFLSAEESQFVKRHSYAKLKKIDSGFDSTVFLGRDYQGLYLVKAYIKLGMVMELVAPNRGAQRASGALTRYHSDVRKVSEMLDSNPGLISLPDLRINNENYKFKVEISDPGRLRFDNGISLSIVREVVPGLNLRELVGREDAMIPDRGNPSKPFLLQLSSFALDPSKSTALWKRDLSPIDFGIIERLDLLNQQLRSISQGKHFFVTEPNLKVLVDSVDKQIIFVITDPVNQIRDHYGGAGPHPRS